MEKIYYDGIFTVIIIAIIITVNVIATYLIITEFIIKITNLIIFVNM